MARCDLPKNALLSRKKALVRVLYRPLVKTCRTLNLRHLPVAGSADAATYRLLTVWRNFAMAQKTPKYSRYTVAAPAGEDEGCVE